jgi:hypothetical protein
VYRGLDWYVCEVFASGLGQCFEFDLTFTVRCLVDLVEDA